MDDKKTTEKTKTKAIKKERKVKLRHRIVFALLRPFFYLYFKLQYNYSYDKYRGKNEGMLILCNHATTLDPFFVAMTFNTQVYFVASDQLFNLGFASRAIEYLVAPIPKTKGMSDTKTIRDIMEVTKEGGKICIFVEGNRTFTGQTCTIPDQIGKLVKIVKKPVMLFNLKGGYFSKPRFAVKPRKGKMRGEIKEVWQPDDYAKKSPEEIYQNIKSALWVDAYEDQEKNPVKYKTKRGAEYLENVLFLCPNCHKFHTFKSSGNYFTCASCGAEVKFGEYGELIPYDNKITFTRILDWFNWEVAYIEENRLYANCYNQPIFFMDDCKLYLDERAKKRDLIDTGKFGLFSDHAEFIGENGKGVYFDFAEVTGMTPQTMGKMQIFTHDGKAYVLTCDKRESTLSYVIMFYMIKNESEGRNNEFLGF